MVSIYKRPCRVGWLVYLRWLPNLLPNDLPLACFVLFDGCQQSCALIHTSQYHFGMVVGSLHHPPRSRHSACPAMQLAFGRTTVAELRTLYQCFLTLPSVLFGKVFEASVKCPHVMSFLSHHLCDLAPAVPGVPHDLQPLLLCRSPRCVGPTLLRRWHR